MNFSPNTNGKIQIDDPQIPSTRDEPIISLSPNLYQPPITPNDPVLSLPDEKLNGQNVYSRDLVPIYAIPANQQVNGHSDQSPDFNYPLQQNSIMVNPDYPNADPEGPHNTGQATNANISNLRRQSTGGQSARRPKPLIFGKRPVEITCGQCNVTGRSIVIEKLDFMMICLIILFTFFIICCFLAICSEMIKVYEHRCSNCNAFVGDSQEISANRNRNDQRR